MKAVLFLFVLLQLPWALPAADSVDSAKTVRGRLLALVADDQKHRAVLQNTKPGSPEWQELWKRQTAVDQANLEALAKIVAEQGWPKRSVVGRPVAQAAFLVLQHAELDSQKQYAPLLRKSVAEGEADAGSLALLEDRILMREGKEQIYGSQLHADETGVLKLWPIRDEANVDQRRAAAGLESLADYLRHFGMVYAGPARPPKSEK